MRLRLRGESTKVDAGGCLRTKGLRLRGRERAMALAAAGMAGGRRWAGKVCSD